MELSTHPQLRDLLRVIPIGQTQEHEGLTLTPLALEVYTDGCLLTVLLQRAQSVSLPLGRFARIKQVDVTMTDDRGGVYMGQMHGHSGSSLPGFWQGRSQCACTPTLDPESRALHIEIPSVHWDYMEETEQGDLGRIPGEITNGPWIFFIQLPAVRT
jgi:hypothetical protein